MPATSVDSNSIEINKNTESVFSPAPAAQVAAVIRTLSAAGADVLIADRRSGKIFTGAQARAILTAAEARAIEPGSAVPGSAA